MIDETTDRRTPAERVDDLPAIQDAMDRAVRRALQRHKQAGNPVAIWRDGAVVRVLPEELPAVDETTAAREPDPTD